MRLTQVGCFFLTPKGTADKIPGFGKDSGRVRQGREADKTRDAYHTHYERIRVEIIEASGIVAGRIQESEDRREVLKTVICLTWSGK